MEVSVESGRVSTFLCYEENISRYCFLKSLLTMEDQLFTQSQNSFLQFAEDSSKTCVNIHLSNQSGKDFMVSPSVPFFYSF